MVLVMHLFRLLVNDIIAIVYRGIINHVIGEYDAHREKGCINLF